MLGHNAPGPATAACPARNDAQAHHGQHPHHHDQGSHVQAAAQIDRPDLMFRRTTGGTTAAMPGRVVSVVCSSLTPATTRPPTALRKAAIDGSNIGMPVAVYSSAEQTTCDTMETMR